VESVNRCCGWDGTPLWAEGARCEVSYYTGMKMKISRTVERLITAADAKDYSLLHVAMDELVAIGAPVIPVLVSELANLPADAMQMGGYGYGHWFSQVLSQIGPDAIEPLSELAREGNRATRYYAVETLARIRHPDTVEPLCAALYDEYHHTRTSPLLGLWDVSDERAIDPLCEILTNRDTDEWERRSAAIALGNIGHARATWPLIAAMQEGRQNLTFNSAQALAKLSDATNLPYRVVVDRTTSAEQRLAILTALKQTRYRLKGVIDLKYPMPDLRGYLCELAQDADAEVSSAAKEVLVEFDRTTLLRGSATHAVDDETLLRGAPTGPGKPGDSLLMPAAAEESSPRTRKRTAWFGRPKSSD
jgi:HEAT repeat protein